MVNAKAPDEKPSYVINLDWYQTNERSFSDVLRSRMCRKHQSKKEEDPAKLIAAFGSCCSKSNDCLTATTPILESVFRLLASSGNQQMNLDQLTQRLAEIRGSSVSSDLLRRLLDRDEFYGITRVPESPEE